VEFDCFHNGGGVPSSSCERFQTLMAEDSATVHDAALADQILPLVPGLVDRLNEGIDVADAGCGQGHAINLMAGAFPAGRFTGYDLSDAGIAAARQEADALGLSNSRFEVCDVSRLPADAGFDLVTAFDSIHDQAHPARVLANIAAVLRPGGTFLTVDIKASSNVEDNLELPWAPFLYTVSTMHCMTVSLALDGDGLGTAWGAQTAVRMLGEAGFGNVEVKEIETDPFNSYDVATRYSGRSQLGEGGGQGPADVAAQAGRLPAGRPIPFDGGDGANRRPHEVLARIGQHDQPGPAVVGVGDPLDVAAPHQHLDDLADGLVRQPGAGGQGRQPGPAGVEVLEDRVERRRRVGEPGRLQPSGHLVDHRLTGAAQQRDQRDDPLCVVCPSCST
jgi:SAM-dependent methyltransferase